MGRGRKSVEVLSRRLSIAEKGERGARLSYRLEKTADIMACEDVSEWSVGCAVFECGQGEKDGQEAYEVGESTIDSDKGRGG